MYKYWQNLKLLFGRSINEIITYRNHRNDERKLLNEIDRIISETKTKIPLVPRYRKLLKEPIRSALVKIDAMTSQIPGPIAFNPKHWQESPVLRAVFLGPDDFSQWIGSCTALQNAFKQNQEEELYGLLVARYMEKTFFGVGRAGEFAQKDVLQHSVYFEDPLIIVPQPDWENAKKELRHRLLIVLFTRELTEIADLKSLTEELEKQQDILEIKLESGKRHHTTGQMDNHTVKEAQKIIHDIDQEIDKIGRHPDTPQSHLKHVTEVLMNIEQHLSMKPFKIRLNSLGVRVVKSSLETYDEISLAECTFTGDHKRSVIWVKINRSSIGQL